MIKLLFGSTNNHLSFLKVRQAKEKYLIIRETSV